MTHRPTTREIETDAHKHAQHAAAWIESAELLDEQERGAAADTAAAIANAHAALAHALAALVTLGRPNP